MFGRWRRGEGSEVQAIVDSAAVRLMVPVKFRSCSMVGQGYRLRECQG